MCLRARVRACVCCAIPHLAFAWHHASLQPPNIAALQTVGEFGELIGSLPQVNLPLGRLCSGQSGATGYKTNNLYTCPCHILPTNLRQGLCETGDASRQAWLRDTHGCTARAVPDIVSRCFFECVTSPSLRPSLPFHIPICAAVSKGRRRCL